MIASLLGWKGYSLTAVVCLAIGFGSGWKSRDSIADAAWTKRDLEEASASLRECQATALAAKRGEAITSDVGSKSAIRQVEIREEIHEIVREIPLAIPAATDAGCIINLGFVRLHDAAATGKEGIPSASTPPDGAASGIELSAVAGAVFPNYGICREDQERLASLQAWITAQADAWNRP
jgi:hypothetical protein